MIYRLICLSCLLLCPQIQPTLAVELKNPSFEKAGDAADLAEHWGRWGHWVNREDSWTPTLSGNCVLGYHHWQIEDENQSGIYQDVEGIQEGERYTFGVYINADDPVGKEYPIDVELRLESSISGQQMHIESKRYDISKLRDSKQAWTLYTVSGTAPTDTLRVLVIFTPAGGERGGAIKLDDAFIKLENPLDAK